MWKVKIKISEPAQASSVAGAVNIYGPGSSQLQMNSALALSWLQARAAATLIEGLYEMFKKVNSEL